MTEPSKYTINNAEVFQVIENNHGTVVGKYEKRQDLAQTAAEIKQLLDQLAIDYPVATEAERTSAVQAIQQKPELQGKIVHALEKGGKKALEKLVDHPAAAIAIAVYEGFRETKA
ncbi:MAG: hypothetical protein ACFCVD_01320 [Nodosilinea sp.]